MDFEKKEFCQLIGKNIRKVRIRKGLTMEELAHLSEIQYRHIFRIETGKVNTSIYLLYKISKTLNTELKEIIETKPQNRVL